MTSDLLGYVFPFGIPRQSKLTVRLGKTRNVHNSGGGLCSAPRCVVSIGYAQLERLAAGAPDYYQQFHQFQVAFQEE